jgi:HPt (histidine-containing phosphotransfer) domain-containing protein
MGEPAQPIDLAHLAQYTGGDARLDADVLRLFAQQSADTVQRLHSLLDMRDAKTWREVAHSLRGAAAGIGAFAVADLAGRAELADPDVNQDKAAECLVRLRESCEVARAFIAAYLKA